jgi:hypothetical protein
MTLVLAIVALSGCMTLNPSGKTASPSPSSLPAGVTNLTAGEELAAGRYSYRDFGDPLVSFEVDGAPWRAVQLWDGFFDIEQGDAEDPHVIAVQFAHPTAVHGSDGAVVPTDAADAVALLGSNPDLDVVETSSSRIDGLDGSQITVENTGDEVVSFIGLPPGTIGINGDRRLWMAFFDTDEGLLAVMIGGSIEKWDEALAAAEPVLESIEIGRPDPSA